MKKSCVLLLAAMPCLAQVRISIQNDTAAGSPRYPRITACNETQALRQLEGWRFRTRDFSGYTTWMSGFTKEGAAPVQYTQSLSPMENRLVAGRCMTPVDYTGVPASGQDGTLFDAQALIKSGSCHEQPPLPDAPALSCAQAETQSAGAAYHGNACQEPRTSQGGFVASFEGRTQIHMVLPKTGVTVNGVPVKWDPRPLGGPLYPMSLAMAQEILHVDWRVLAAMGAKESFFSMVEAGKEDKGLISAYPGDVSGVYSPWQFEEPTFLRLVQTYPEFFPAHGPCLNRYPDLLQASACSPGGSSATPIFYLQTPGTSPRGTGNNSPQIANVLTSASLNLYWVFDALLRATDFPMPRALTIPKDPRLVLSALLAACNLGIYSGFETPLKDTAILHDPAGSQRFATGNSNYRPQIFAVLDALDSAARHSTACGGDALIYDAPISLTDVQRFFFGGSVTPGTPAAQGDGGLLLHFSLSPSQRQALLSDLECTFAKLKGKAPSTTGQGAISFRYDWLTLLRVAKARLPVRREPSPVNDLQAFIRVNGKKPITAEGLPKDSTYPNLTLLTPPGQVPAADSAGFRLGVKAVDDASVLKVEWTLDSTWRDWSSAYSSGGLLEVRIACGSLGLPAAGQAGRLWVRAIDGCGNATVQEVGFNQTIGGGCWPVAIRSIGPMKRQGRLPLSGELGSAGMTVLRPAGDGMETFDLGGRRIDRRRP